MKCPNCTSTNHKGSRFCKRCGADLSTWKANQQSDRVSLAYLTGGILISILLITGFLFGMKSLNNTFFEIDLQELQKQESPIVTNKISKSELARAENIANHFITPAVKDKDAAPLSLDTVMDDTGTYDLKRVSIIGDLVYLENVVSFREQDWPSATIIKLASMDHDLLLVYRGDPRLLIPGDTVVIDGLYIASEGGMLAYNIKHAVSNSFLERKENMWMLRWLTLSAICFLFSISFVLWKTFYHKTKIIRHLSTILLFMVTTMIISACRVEMVTVINEDGSGTISTTLRRAKEDVDYMREIPQMNAYLDAILEEMRGQGVYSETMRSRQDEIITFQRHFESIEKAYSESDIQAGETWFDVDRFVDGDDTVIRYYGMVDTSTIYNNLDNLPSYAVEPVREELDASVISMKLILPGLVTYHNGLTAGNNSVEWEIRNDDITEIVAESRIANTQIASTTKSNLPATIRIVSMILFGVSLLLLLFGLLGWKKRKQQRGTGHED
jgi:hypothetical protein